MSLLNNLLQRLLDFLRRHPGTVALFGFASGLASFLLVQRSEHLARIIALLMLVSWLALVLENSLQRYMARWFGINLAPPVLRFATQMVHQESLFFVLPFFAVTTSWLSGQALFTLLLGGTALVSIIDPLYHRMAQRRWLYFSYHSFTLFAVLLTTLPLILHLKTPQSYRLALLVAVLFALPSFTALLPRGRWWRLPAMVSMSVLLCLLGWQLRLWVPPATLWLTQVAVSNQVDDDQRAPGLSLRNVAEQRLVAEGLYAYTAIRAPQGLDERIYHVWLLNGKEVDRIPIDIHGGRKEGYRAWTHKRHFPAQAAGDWQVRVLTEAGQMIGRLGFHVAAVQDDAAPATTLPAQLPTADKPDVTDGPAQRMGPPPPQRPTPPVAGATREATP